MRRSTPNSRRSGQSGKLVLDASTFVSAALKADSIPERALLRAIAEPDRLLLSQAVEDEYREGCRRTVNWTLLLGDR